MGGSGFIPAPALQSGWGSKLGLLEGLEELQGKGSQNPADEKCLQPWSPALKSHLWPKEARDLAGGSPSRVRVRGRSWGARALLVLEKCRELAQLSQGRHV